MMFNKLFWLGGKKVLMNILGQNHTVLFSSLKLTTKLTCCFKLSLTSPGKSTAWNPWIKITMTKRDSHPADVLLMTQPDSYLWKLPLWNKWNSLAGFGGSYVWGSTSSLSMKPLNLYRGWLVGFVTKSLYASLLEHLVNEF